MEKSFYDLPPEEILRNTKTKVYPDGSTASTFCNQYIFCDIIVKEKYKEEIEKYKAECKSQKEQEKENNKTNEIKRKYIKTEERERDDAIKRARDKCFDIARLNTWKYFITITFDGSKYESENPEFVMKKIRNYLHNKVKLSENKSFKFLLIPEYHKSGKIHCHALVSEIDTVDSGTRLVKGYPKPVKLETVEKRGLTVKQIVYNIPSWKYGFSTAIEINNSTAFAFYITKYITKGNKKIFGNYYWAGGGVVREPKIIYHNTDFESVPRSSFSKGYYSYKYQSNNCFIPDFENLSAKFNNIPDFLEYLDSDEFKNSDTSTRLESISQFFDRVYSDNYKKECDEYAEKNKSSHKRF